MVVMRRLVPVALLCLWCLSGCYAYVPSSVGEVTPEQKVRVRLAPGETARLREYVNPDTRTLGGAVVEQSADSLLLLVPGRTELQGVRVETFYQRIQVGKAGILAVETRRLDRGKTYLVSGAAVAVVAAVAIKQLRGPGGTEVLPRGGGPNDALVPVFALRLPLRLLGLLGR